MINKIIFCTQEEKTAFLKSKMNQKDLQKEKYMTYDELVSKYYFTYEQDAIAYLMENYNYNYDYASLLLRNLIAIENKTYETEKLNYLKDLKLKLENQNLLKKDEYFKDYLKRFNLFYTSSPVDKFTQKILIEINAKELKKELASNSKKDIFLFDSLAEEVEYLYQSIAKLLEEGLTLDKIKIIGLDETYEKDIARLSDLFGIYFSNIKKPLASYHIIKTYLQNLKETESFEKSLSNLKEKYNENNPKYYNFYRNLLREINKVKNLNSSFETKEKILIALLNKNKYLERYKNQIEVLNPSGIYLNNDEHLFIVGLNQSILPKIFRDDDYLKDFEKDILDIESSVEKNKRFKQIMKDIILFTKNIYISANLYDGIQSRKLSNLADELELTIIKNPKFDSIYNLELAKIQLAKYLDDFIKYDIENPNLANYNASLKLDYGNYDNSFSGINNDGLKRRIKDKLVLSYSSLDKFNHCAFKYYIDHILKISKYEETFAINLGNLFHLALSEWSEKDIDPLVTWDAEVSKLTLKSSEKFILNNLKEELLFVFKSVEKLHSETELKNIKSEVELLIDLDERTAFKGFVDKIMHLNKDGEDELVLIDYKTGSAKLNINNIDFGFDLQLPIYWYLISRSNLFSNPKFTGLYIHSLLSNPSFLDFSKTLKEEKAKGIKLSGYSSNDITRLSRFDKTVEKSEFINGISITASGELKKSKRLLSDEKILEIDQKVDKIINDAKDRIWQGDFQIEAKYLQNKLVSCKWCKYRDLCFRQDKDRIYLNKEVGDENEMD